MGLSIINSGGLKGHGNPGELAFFDDIGGLSSNDSLRIRLEDGYLVNSYPTINYGEVNNFGSMLTGGVAVFNDTAVFNSLAYFYSGITIFGNQPIDFGASPLHIGGNVTFNGGTTFFSGDAVAFDHNTRLDIYGPTYFIDWITMYGNLNAAVANFTDNVSFSGPHVYFDSTFTNFNGKVNLNGDVDVFGDIRFSEYTNFAGITRFEYTSEPIFDSPVIFNELVGFTNDVEFANDSTYFYGQSNFYGYVIFNDEVEFDATHFYAPADFYGTAIFSADIYNLGHIFHSPRLVGNGDGGDFYIMIQDDSTSEILRMSMEEFKYWFNT